MACRVFIIVYSIIQAIVFLFILVGTPIDQFRSKNTDLISNDGCLTFWGQKEKCYSTKYELRPPTIFKSCDARKTRFQAAEAFGIISIALTLLAMIFGFIQLCCCRCLRWACLVFNILAVATICICWACMVSEYYTNRFSVGSIALDDPTVGVYCRKLEADSKYGAGFALYVVGWCLNIINIVFLMLPC